MPGNESESGGAGGDNGGNDPPPNPAPNPSPPTDDRARGRHRRNGGRGGRGRGRGGRGGRGVNRSNTTVEEDTPSTAPLKAPLFCLPSESKSLKTYDKTVAVLRTYVLENLEYGDDLFPIIDDMKDLDMTTIRPKEPDANASKVEEKMFELEVEHFFFREKAYIKNAAIGYDLIWNQCSKGLQQKLLGVKGYIQAKKSKNMLWLLQSVKDTVYQFDKVKPLELSSDDALERILKCRQGQMDLPEFHKTFMNYLKVYEQNAGYFGVGSTDILALQEDLKSKQLSDDEYSVQFKEGIQIIRDRAVGIAFIKRADKHRYQELQNNLQNNFLNGTDDYPNDISEALNKLTYFRPTLPPVGRPTSNGYESGLSFFLASSPHTAIAGTDGNINEEWICYRCGCPGHKSFVCPKSDADAATSLAAARAAQPVSTSTGVNFSSFSFHNCSSSFMRDLRDHYILLDSQGSDHLFCNENLVDDVKGKGFGLKTHSNGGSLQYCRQGSFRGLSNVWLNTNGIANILSLGRLTDLGLRITLDTWNADDAFVVHLHNTQLRFVKLRECLYVLDLRTINEPFSFHIVPTKTANKNIPVTPAKNEERENEEREPVTFQNEERITNEERKSVTFLNTVREREAQFNRREVQGANMAINLRRHLGSVSKTALTNSVQQLQDCPLTVADVKRSVYIHGDYPSSAKGRSTWKKPTPVPVLNPINIPDELFKDIQNITLCIDFFYVNGIPVFHTISKNVKFRSVSFPTNKTHATILQEYNDVKRLYEAQGFNVTQVCADNEFDCIRMDIMPAHLETVGANEHVPEVERSIRYIKECTRACLHDLPYTKISKQMTIGIIKTTTKYCNAFYGADNVGDKLSPRNIVLGLPNLSYKRVCQMRTCMPAMVTVKRKKTNTMSTRAVEAIALSPQNDHGAWYFQSLSTGRKIRSHIYKPLPISDRIINRVKELGTQDNMPDIQDGRMIFEWTPGDPIDDDDLEVLQMNVAAQGENNEANNNVVLQNNQFAAFTDDDDDYDSDEDSDFDEDDDDDNEEQNIETVEENIEDNEDNEEESIDDIIAEVTAMDDPVNNENSDGDEIEVEDVSEEDSDGEDDDPPKENTGRGHRTRRPNSKYYNESFSFLQTPFEELKVDDRKEFFKHATDAYMTNGDTRLLQRFITGFVFTQMQTTEQMSAKKGIEIFGDEAVEALFKELAQLVDMSTFKPRKAEDLTRAQKRAALRAINLIKRKRCGKLKGRTVANGKQQRGKYDKSRTASPTVTLEGLLMTCMIEAMEGRHVAVADVVGAYLKARMEDFVLMKFTGETVDILCDIDPSYKEYVTIENGEKVLYVELLKALYGCVQSALLWYELFSGSLVDMGFELNPFDMCIANATINGSQCTVCIYVDDNKISHKELAVVKDIIAKLESKFGKMEVSFGDEHTFLGMKIKYNRKKRTVTIDMKEYLLEAIEESGMDITRNAMTPAKPNLYIINEESELLNEDKKERFHSVVAKLCYIAERSRLDIKPAMSFLRTRVQKPTIEDWGKLKRVLCYIRGTIDLHLTLGADSLTKLQTWVDASYAIHNDRKSHTGGAMSFGRGVVCSKSNKQKLNTKSSTEAEVVGASDYLPNTIWLRMFLEAQGYIIEESIYYQDNESAMKIEMNGWRSTGSKSKHVDIRFYFIADRIKSEKIEIHHCKTEHMVADFFTKPLQGALFRRLRDIVMGVVPIDNVFDYSKQERVVKNGNSKSDTGKGDSQGSSSALDESPRGQQEHHKHRSYAEVTRGNK